MDGWMDGALNEKHAEVFLHFMCRQETLTFPDHSEPGNPGFQVSAHIKWQLLEKSSFYIVPQHRVLFPL